MFDINNILCIFEDIGVKAICRTCGATYTITEDILQTRKIACGGIIGEWRDHEGKIEYVLEED